MGAVLFVRLDVTRLTTVCTLPRSTSWLFNAGNWCSGWARRTRVKKLLAGHGLFGLLLFAGVATILVALETVEFLLYSVHKMLVVTYWY